MSSTRDFGFSIGPIPFDAMLRYAEFKQLDRQNTALFLGVMRELDEVYLNHLRSQQKTKKHKSEK